MTTKSDIEKHLPKCFTSYIGKNGLVINIKLNGNTVFPGHNEKHNTFEIANALVKKCAKSLNLELEEIGSGCCLSSGNLDWTFVSKDAEKEFIAEGKEVLKSMQALFKKWGNSYTATGDMYKVVDKMRALVETDEN